MSVITDTFIDIVGALVEILRRKTRARKPWFHIRFSTTPSFKLPF